MIIFIQSFARRQHYNARVWNKANGMCVECASSVTGWWLTSGSTISYFSASPSTVSRSQWNDPTFPPTASSVYLFYNNLHCYFVPPFLGEANYCDKGCLLVCRRISKTKGWTSSNFLCRFMLTMAWSVGLPLWLGSGDTFCTPVSWVTSCRPIIFHTNGSYGALWVF